MAWFDAELQHDLGDCDLYYLTCNLFMIGKSTFFSYMSPILMLFMFFTYIALYIFLNLFHLFLLLGGWILRILGKATKFHRTDFFSFLFADQTAP